MKSERLNARAAVVLSTIAVLTLSFGLSTTRAQSSPSWGPQWTADGELKLPSGFREWVYLGSPLTPHALNGRLPSPNITTFTSNLKLFGRIGPTATGPRAQSC